MRPLVLITLAVAPLGSAPLLAQDLPPELRRDPATSEWVLEPELLEIVRNDPELGEAIRAGLDWVALGLEEKPVPREASDHAKRKRSTADRRVRIREELELLGAHEWAGVYHAGGGYTGHILEIAPDAGATYEYWSCISEGYNHGDVVSFADGRLTLDLAFEPAPRSYEFDRGLARPFLTSEWFLVRWGNERYLVPSSQMIPFCNAVPDERSWTDFCRFPRRNGARTTLREADLPARPPEVPSPYRRYLLERSIDCTVVEATVLDGAPRSLRALPGRRFHLVRAKTDAGAAQGLLPGMSLRVVEPALKRSVGEVVHVGATSSVVDFRIALGEGTDPEPYLPRVGWTLRAGR